MHRRCHAFISPFFVGMHGSCFLNRLRPHTCLYVSPSKILPFYFHFTWETVVLNLTLFTFFWSWLAERFFFKVGQKQTPRPAFPGTEGAGALARPPRVARAPRPR